MFRRYRRVDHRNAGQAAHQSNLLRLNSGNDSRRRIFPAKKLPRQQGGQNGQSATEDVRQRRNAQVKYHGEQRAENARQAPGALRDTDGGALLVRRREIREQSEERRPRQAGADGQQRQRQKHLDPRPVGRVQDRQPLELAVAFDERQEDQADAGQEQAQGNQFRFAEHFDQPPDGAALDDRANDATKDKQGDDRHGGFGFVHGNAEVEIVADEQRQGAFKTTEGESRQKKNQD